MNDREAVTAALDVSRETSERLATYVELLKKWNPSINLVARSTLDEAWTRHIADSAQVYEAARKDASTWVDMGSGGGFPGLVVAILAAAEQPDLRVTLIESDQRKATFLRAVLRETGVTANVVVERIEAVPPLAADVVSARALAPLTHLLGIAALHIAPDGVALFPKGAGYGGEVQEALETWSFRCEEIASKTSEDGVILRIGDIERV